MFATDRMTARQGLEHDPRKESESDPLRPEALRRRYDRLRSQRSAWEALWQDCYDYSLPARRPGSAPGGGNAGRVAERLFDATAADAAEQLAATLLAQLTPPWSRWFAFQPGRDAMCRKNSAARWPANSTALPNCCRRSSIARISLSAGQRSQPRQAVGSRWPRSQLRHRAVGVRRCPGRHPAGLHLWRHALPCPRLRAGLGQGPHALRGDRPSCLLQRH
jgi:hypothetical protein